MSVFISWSGERSRGLALALRDWLNTVIQRLPVFVSTQDLAAGVQWSETVVGALRGRSEARGCEVSTSVSESGMDLVINRSVGIRIISLEGSIYNRLRNHLIQMRSAFLGERLSAAIVVFTREPGPDIRDLLAATKSEFGVGLAWSDAGRFYADRRARELAPWMAAAPWEPGRKPAS